MRTKRSALGRPSELIYTKPGKDIPTFGLGSVRPSCRMGQDVVELHEVPLYKRWYI